MRFLPAIMIFGATAASYAYVHEDGTPNPQGNQKSFFSDWFTTDDQMDKPRAGDVETIASAPRESMVAVEGPEITNFVEIFRFDMTPQGVRKRWSRVTTGLADTRYQGYRVPLVTGTEESDLAGSLSYYFDSRPRLRKITFTGTTGDPGRLVDLVTKQFGFSRSQNRNPRVATFTGRFRFRGQLRIAAAEVLDRHESGNNFKVDLVVER